MSKRKAKLSDEQLGFLEFIPLSKDVSDMAIEAEIYQESGHRIYPDDHPLLLKWREAYFEEWIRRYPDGYCARYSQWRE